MKTFSGWIGAGIAASAIVVLAQTGRLPQRFTAGAVNTNNGGTGTVELVIERWSTEGDRNLLVSTLLDKGSDELLDALQDMPRIGYIRIDGGLGYDLHYAHVTQGEDGGERIVLATDRRIGFWEATNQPRSIDYPFTVIELRLNRDGEGQGKMSLATRITADKEKNSVTLENYDSSLSYCSRSSATTPVNDISTYQLESAHGTHADDAGDAIIVAWSGRS